MTESTGMERSAATGVARSEANQLRTSRLSMSAIGRPEKQGRIWLRRYAAADRGRRQAGALDQVPDGVRQAADGQGAGRLRLRRLARQRAPDPGARRRRLPGGQAQHRGWSAAPAPARPISPSPSRGPASERAHAAGATTSSTWSTTSRPSSAPDARAAPQTSSSDATSSSSTSSATCPSPRPAGSCSSTS